EPSASTRNQRYSTISSFYRFAREFTTTGEDGRPTALFQRPLPTAGFRTSAPEIDYHALSEEELLAFFAAIPTTTVIGLRDRSLFLTYFWTARRAIEIASMRRGDIQKSIIVEGRQRRPGWVYHFRGKGRSAVEDVAELPGAAKAVIDTYLEASGRIRTICATDYVWVGTGKQTPLTPNAINWHIKGYSRGAGID